MRIFTKTLSFRVAVMIVMWACNTNTSTDSKTTYMAPPASTEFDLIILNARVMDPETEFDGIRLHRHPVPCTG